MGEWGLTCYAPRSITCGDISVKPALARLIRLVVRGYPRAWRERYEAEFLALIDDSPVTWRTVVDVLRSAGHEWARAAAARARDPRVLEVGADLGRTALGAYATAWVLCALFYMVDVGGLHLAPGALRPAALVAAAGAVIQCMVVVRLPLVLAVAVARRRGWQIGSGWRGLLKCAAFVTVVIVLGWLRSGWVLRLEPAFGAGYDMFMFVAAFPTLMLPRWMPPFERSASNL
jgi:hypothetical protein